MNDFFDRLNNQYWNDLGPAWSEVREWLTKLAELFLEGCEQIADWFFAMTRQMGILRWLVITFVGAGIWAIFAFSVRDKAATTIDNGLAAAQVRYVTCTVRSALTSNPQKFSRENRCYSYKIARSYTLEPLIFEIPFNILFASGVFRHILLVGFAIWTAFKIAALYQSNIYNLPDTSGAEHFILQSALINPNNIMNIRDGRVASKDQNLPLFRIGGPGKVCVHLENAALFEKIDGEPHVIGPIVKGKAQVTQLDGFERLRSIIDLRDQKEQFDIPGRSRDGIRVRAKDVRVFYSIYRDYQEPTYDRPYPFHDPEAIENLVYKQGGGTWNVAIANQIRGELLDFFSKHLLSEFLAMIEKPEWDKFQQNEEELREEGSRWVGVPPSSSPPLVGGAPGIDFVARPQITDKFYTRSEELRSARGVQINWIGVGTWDFPVRIFSARHQDAWQITHTNLVRSQPAVMNALRNQRRLGEILRLIQSVPIATYRTNMDQSVPIDDMLRALILAYFHQMRAAYEDYQREILEIDREESVEQDPVRRIELQDDRLRLNDEFNQVRDTLVFLTRFTARWLGGP